jgi:hypothetical protein
MRITIKEQVKIRELTERYFGKGSTVRLFGSRVDDSKRGGDIDLYVEPTNRQINLLDARANLWGELQVQLGEQKIDIVLANEEKLLIDQEAITKGVILMNYKDAKLVEVIHECNRHLIVLNRQCKVLNSIMPLTVNSFESLSLEAETALDVFLFRFTKLQDVMGAKLFPTLLESFIEEIKEMTFIDRINRLDELGLVSLNEWKPIRDKRNDVAHEYPSTPQITVNALNAAYGALSELYAISKRCIEFVHTQNILPAQIDKKLNVKVPFFKQWENSDK